MCTNKLVKYKQQQRDNNMIRYDMQTFNVAVCSIMTDSQLNPWLHVK